MKNRLGIVEGTVTVVTLFDAVTSKRYECHRYIAHLANHYYYTCCGGFVT
ncbi:MAG: hypothetical protein WBN72_04160 [Nitrososphaeraceae archaeon]